MRFEIDRARWRSGGDHPNRTGRGPTFLRNHEGYMCCLGFLALACGVPEEKIAERRSLTSTDEQYHTMYPRGFAGRSSDSNEVMAVHLNDWDNLPRDLREAQLVEFFAEKGIEVVFTGEYE